ncbi:hypothetical protein SH668x_003714 [Planctomicrobium sp. SH668]|jgi:hypothetical protein|uniref:hypothetical protein n=1 Tax=Planctomicrobium sp. SH668 TaxID=3448126 RepID=UPI003F5C5530|nr:hypothetical protein [Planctomycetaceae bacterium]
MFPHSPPQAPPPGDRLTMAASFNTANFLSHAHALALTVFLRTDFGREGIGIHGLVTFVLILGYGSFAQCYAMFPFFLLWILAVICQRVRQFVNWRRGVIIHSYYNGYPWLSKRLFPRMSELNAKGVDAFLCLAIGGVIAQFDKPFGLFIMAGFASILFTEAVIVESTKRRLQAMQDAELEQRYLAEKYKSGRF